MRNEENRQFPFRHKHSLKRSRILRFQMIYTHAIYEKKQKCFFFPSTININHKLRTEKEEK